MLSEALPAALQLRFAQNDNGGLAFAKSMTAISENLRRN